MFTKKTAFTMIELVFVIVVLGILAAIAIPKFAATRTDAQITKGRADVATIRSAIISERQARLIKGDSAWISQLSDNNDTLFTKNNLLMYGISAGTTAGHWSRTATNSYVFKLPGNDCAFTYSSTDGKFTLNSNQNAICDQLVK